MIPTDCSVLRTPTILRYHNIALKIYLCNEEIRMKSCLIVTGGEYSPFTAGANFDLVIACDRGYQNCKKAGVRPDVVIGDMDSYTGMIEGAPEQIRLNPVKDDTDTISAVRHALKLGANDITVCCAFGGRLDHTLANVQTVAFILENGALARMLGKETEIYGVKDMEVAIPRKEGCALSVFSLSDGSEGVCISGTKYTLSNATLSNRYPIGVSNEWESDMAVISVKRGTLIAVVSKKTEFE